MNECRALAVPRSDDEEREVRVGLYARGSIHNVEAGEGNGGTGDSLHRADHRIGARRGRAKSDTAVRLGPINNRDSDASRKLFSLFFALFVSGT